MTKTMATVSYHVNYGTDELGVRRTKELTKDFETYQEAIDFAKAIKKMITTSNERAEKMNWSKYKGETHTSIFLTYEVTNGNETATHMIGVTYYR